jgi:hypothetical protein
MELIWSNDGVSTLLLPAKILFFSEEKENLCKKITKCCALEKLTAKRRNKYNEIWRNQKKCLHLPPESKHSIMTMQQPEKPYSEYLNDIQEMCDNVKLIKAGKLKGRPVESLLDEL